MKKAVKTKGKSGGSSRGGSSTSGTKKQPAAAKRKGGGRGSPEAYGTSGGPGDRLSNYFG